MSDTFKFVTVRRYSTGAAMADIAMHHESLSRLREKERGPEGLLTLGEVGAEAPASLAKVDAEDSTSVFVEEVG